MIDRFNPFRRSNPASARATAFVPAPRSSRARRFAGSTVRSAVAVLVVLALAAGATAPAARTQVAPRQERAIGARSIRFELDTARTHIGFFANATVGSFEGDAQRFRGRAEVADTTDLSGTGGWIEIDVASFSTGIGMRDRHLRGELDAREHPTITYTVTGAQRVGDEVAAEAGLESPEGEPERAPAIIYGTLTVRGKTRDVATYAMIRFTADTLYALGRVPVRFTDFDIKPPTRMLGMTKVDDELVLFFDAVFASQIE